MSFIGYQRTVLAIIGASLVISAAILLGLDGFSPNMVFGLPFGSWLMGGLGMVILMAAWPSDYE
ncbi:MAG: hypothetical protein GY731_05580 [Gammaproteobacteria bacterium]|nr:hypothetical protein [Gammaproteobacteria bacterium]